MIKCDTHTHTQRHIYCEIIATIVLVSPHMMTISVHVVIRFKTSSLTILSSSADIKKQQQQQQQQQQQPSSPQMGDVNYSMIMSKQL